MRITGEDKGPKLIITVEFEDQEEKDNFQNDFFEMLKSNAERNDATLLNADLEEISTLEEGIISQDRINKTLRNGPLTSQDLDDVVSKFTK